MKTKTGKAPVSQTGAKPTLNAFPLADKSYQICSAESIAKLQIGTLLLALQNPLNQKQQKACWVLFESVLRDYVDLRFLTHRA